MIEIHTARLTLRKLTADDKPALIAELGNWEVSKWLRLVPHPYTEKDADNLLAKVSEDALNLHIFKHDRLIGGAGIMRDEVDAECHELSYWLGQPYWGSGYASEAVQAVLDYAINELNYKKIKATYINGNEQSAKLLEKLGLKVIGTGTVHCLSHGKEIPCVNHILEV